MPITQQENRNEVKKIKFHHRVKRFYYKNLFRKIYTAAIIGLIGANIFSMVKYQSFADELESYEQSEDNTLEVADVDHTKDIVIQVTVTEPGQQLTIYKYFTNYYTINRGDDTVTASPSSTSPDFYYTHTYEVAGTYDVTLSLGSSKWTFYQGNSKCGLVPSNCYMSINRNGQYLKSTVTNVKIKSMPSLEWFGNGTTNPGDYFFAYFNKDGALESLPANSFQFSSNLTEVSSSFFSYFNSNGALTELPANSFNTSNIESVGNNFFSSFNSNGKLTELPANSFNTSNIETAGDCFFYYFNSNGKLTELPADSFKLSSKLVSVGNYFFYDFNGGGKLTELPSDSFNTSNIESVGYGFFSYFNDNGALTELPANSFQFSSNLTEVSSSFFSYFNSNGALTELPENSFNTSKIESVGYGFFGSFNENGKLTSLPEGSFNTSNIVSVDTNYNSSDYYGYSFFQRFNYNGAITHLPTSFTINPVGVSKYRGYAYAFYSPDYTLDKNVSDLVAGIEVPSDDKNTFSDNQPGRCGLHGNRLYSVENACSDSECGAGYHGVNNYCVSDDGGVYYGDGYIEIRNGNKVFYIKDRNQGATKSLDEINDKIDEIYDLQNEMCEQIEVPDNTPCEEDLHVMCGTVSVQQCSDEFYVEAGKIIGITNATKKDIDEFMGSVYGNYYYRGNNTGATYEELGIGDLSEANVSPEAYNRGFNGGVMGEDPNNGWIEGKIQDNPCDASKGEYLPTVSDWKDAMKLWSDIHGYDLYSYVDNDYGHFYPMYDGNSYYGDYLISNFRRDMLVSDAGYIHQYQQGGMEEKSLSYNNIQNRLMDSLAMVFSNPVYALDIGGYDMAYDSSLYLHMALDSGYNYGTISEYDLSFYNFNYRGYDNTIAAPVRCFIKSNSISHTDEYTVKFETNGGDEISPRRVKSGKFLKNVEIPEKYGEAFEGWYTDSGLKNKFNMETTPVTSNMTLYAKWGKGVTHKDGYIKVTNGKDTVYIRDRNVGVSDTALNYMRYKIRNNSVYDSDDDAIHAFNEMFGVFYSDFDEISKFSDELRVKILDGIIEDNEMVALKYMLKYWEIDNQCNFEDSEEAYDSCMDDNMLPYVYANVLPYINENLEVKDPIDEFSDFWDADDYIREYLGDECYKADSDYYRDLVDQQANGNYYFRGNNSGINYNDLATDDISNLNQDFLKGGNIGVEGEGWIEGNVNPCDGEGEYLPTPEDWKNLLKIWGSLYGEDLSDDSFWEYDEETGDEYRFYSYYFNNRNNFQNDMLIPDAGSIYGYKDDNEVFDELEWRNDTYLWLSQNEKGNLGVLRPSYYIDYSNNTLLAHNNYYGDYAAPVRCFIKSDAIAYYDNNNSSTDNSGTDNSNTNTGSTTTTDTPSSNGGSSSSRPHKTDKDKTHDSAEETQTDKDNTKEENKTTTTDDQQGKTMAGLVKSEITVKDTVVSNNATYTSEQNKAYQFAKSNGITTTSSIKEAKMNTPLTRIEMAKMLSQYAMNVLGQTPDASRGIVKFKDVTNKMNTQYDNGVTLAYQLGIMGINMPNNKFRPNDKVTRAEFATALSRMLYGMEDGTGKLKYYEPHIARLYNEGIINNTNPKMEELRGYVMIMLMRTSK